MKRTSLQARPYAHHQVEKRVKSLGALVSVKASTEQTGGAFNLFDVSCPAGYATPLHIHYAEDGAIQLLEGTLDIFWGDEKKRAEAGSFFFQPRGTPHGFRVTGKTRARMLYFTFPGRFDEFVMERSKPITDSEAVVLEAQYSIETLGPLPE